MSMGMSSYFDAFRLKAGKICGSQHIGWRKYTFLCSPGERARRNVKRARQLPFGESGHRVIGEVGEAIIHGNQHGPRRKLGLSLQPVSELRNGHGLSSAGHYHVEVVAERDGTDGESRDPIGRVGRDRMIQENRNRAHHDVLRSAVRAKAMTSSGRSRSCPATAVMPGNGQPETASPSGTARRRRSNMRITGFLILSLIWPTRGSAHLSSGIRRENFLKLASHGETRVRARGPSAGSAA